MKPHFSTDGVNAKKVRDVFMRQGPPAGGERRGQLPATEIRFPNHHFPPRQSLPIYPNARVFPVSNTDTVIVSFQVDTGRTLYLQAIEEELTAFSVGVTEMMVEFMLTAGGSGVPPYTRHRGVLSPRGNPRLHTITMPITSERKVELHARILSTVEGGLDGGTVAVWAALQGYQVESLGGT